MKGHTQNLLSHLFRIFQQKSQDTVTALGTIHFGAIVFGYFHSIRVFIRYVVLVSSTAKISHIFSVYVGGSNAKTVYIYVKRIRKTS